MRGEYRKFKRPFPQRGAGIAGLPRTGTSLLQGLLAPGLLAPDPANRTPLSWEVMAPSPPPAPAQDERDPRIAPVERRMRCLDWLAPIGFFQPTLR